MGCPGDAYFDMNEINEGRPYRINEGVDIKKFSSGGYNVGWIHQGEWLAYTIAVKKSATYRVSFYLASAFASGNFHPECNGKQVAKCIAVPNTRGFQNWQVITTTLKLDAGQYVLKFVSEGESFNIDKMVFDEMK